MSSSPDIARLQPTSDSLNVILRNTHFPDHILEKDSDITIVVDFVMDLPVLVIKFPQPYYNFLEILGTQLLESETQEWVYKEKIVIKLVLSDTVFTDRLTTKRFTLEITESEKLRKQLFLLKQMEPEQVQDAKDHVYANLNRFLG